jgi:hypothetical protein
LKASKAVKNMKQLYFCLSRFEQSDGIVTLN